MKLSLQLLKKLGSFSTVPILTFSIQSMSDVGKCYDNARMESFFATLKKEKLYKIKTEKMTVEEVNTVVFQYVMVYYNRKRITTVNPDGLPPSIYRERFEVQSSVA